VIKAQCFPAEKQQSALKFNSVPFFSFMKQEVFAVTAKNSVPVQSWLSSVFILSSALGSFCLSSLLL